MRWHKIHSTGIMFLSNCWMFDLYCLQVTTCLTFTYSPALTHTDSASNLIISFTFSPILPKSNWGWITEQVYLDRPRVLRGQGIRSSEHNKDIKLPKNYPKGVQNSRIRLKTDIKWPKTDTKHPKPDATFPKTEKKWWGALPLSVPWGAYTHNLSNSNTYAVCGNVRTKVS